MTPELRVSTIEDDGYVVRGTMDVDMARAAVVAYRRADDAHSEEYEPEYAENVPPVNRVGWFRWNPCNPAGCWNGGGHVGHLDYVDGAGRGRWIGVYFAHSV